ncbi:hypothetical protein VDG1235_1691 [Verrucomicrobiia bacterium DG1235]|nr:hypothetical protein VDG1235_1691 [Verrucomicrobiae bacterium DG1235]
MLTPDSPQYGDPRTASESHSSFPQLEANFQNCLWHWRMHSKISSVANLRACFSSNAIPLKVGKELFGFNKSGRRVRPTVVRQTAATQLLTGS